MEKGWLMSADSTLNVDQLPHWMGQITLKGVVTDRVSSVRYTCKFDDPYHTLALLTTLTQRMVPSIAVAHGIADSLQTSIFCFVLDDTLLLLVLVPLNIHVHACFCLHRLNVWSSVTSSIVLWSCSRHR